MIIGASCLTALVLVFCCLLHKPNHRIASLLLASIGVLFVSGALLCWNTVTLWHISDWISIGLICPEFKVDSLAAFFLLSLGTITTCCAVYSPAYLHHLADKINSRFYWSAQFAFVLGMAGVLISANAVVFLVAWEVMSLASACLVVSEFRQHRAQRAAMIYLVATRMATGFISAGFLIMYSICGDWSFDSWQFSDHHKWLAASLLMLGLIIKAGVWPFHIWLPYAHPEAPSPVSALMSGVMVKVSIFALIRFFVFGHLTCAPLIYGLFALACISAFWGILFAINQRELKRVLAYSTVENVGLILVGVSLCIWANNLGLTGIAKIALTGALLHSFGHGLFKSLLFLCAGSVDYAAHTRDLSLLGGLAKTMPSTGIAFIAGSSAICALPPFNGFASKWCLYQGLLQSSFTMPLLIDRAITLGAIGLLSCVGALAIATFAKAIAVAFLGNARSPQSRKAKEVPLSMKVPQTFLALCCLVAGVSSPWLAPPLMALIPGTNGLQPPISIFATLPLWQVGLALTVMIMFFYGCVLNKAPHIDRTWDCGFGSLGIKSQVTGDSFAQPIARIFSPILRHKLAIHISGRERRHFPERIVVEPSMVSLLETRLYRPAANILDRISRMIGKLQAGSIHLYLLYVCLALVLVVFAGIFLW